MKIEIENRESIEKRAATPFAPRTAIISITDTDYHFAELKNQPAHLLQLKFNDVCNNIFEDFLERKPTEEEAENLMQQYNMITDGQAEIIADFVKSIRREVKTLICNCEYGQSRSAAVAAAIRQYLCGDGIEIFTDDRYFPNKAVYKKVYAALCADEYVCRDKRYEFFLGIKDTETNILNQYALTRPQAKAVLILLGLKVASSPINVVYIVENADRFDKLLQPFGVDSWGYHGLYYEPFMGRHIKQDAQLIFGEDGNEYEIEADNELDRWGVLHLIVEGLKAYNAEHYAEWSKPYSYSWYGKSNLGTEIWNRYCDDVIDEVDKLP